MTSLTGFARSLADVLLFCESEAVFEDALTDLDTGNEIIEAEGLEPFHDDCSALSRIRDDGFRPAPDGVASSRRCGAAHFRQYYHRFTARARRIHATK